MARYGYLENGNPDPAVVYGTGPWPESWGGPQPPTPAKAAFTQPRAAKLPECGCPECWAEYKARKDLDAMEAELGPAGMKAHSGPKGRLTAMRERWHAAYDAAGQAHGFPPLAVDEG